VVVVGWWERGRPLCIVEKIEQRYDEWRSKRSGGVGVGGARAVEVKRACQAMGGCGIERWCRWSKARRNVGERDEACVQQR